MAKLQINNVDVITETGGVATVASATKFPAGHIIQCKQFVTTTEYALTTTMAYSGLGDSITITSGNKIKLSGMINLRTYGNAGNSWLTADVEIHRSTDGTNFSAMTFGGGSVTRYSGHYRDHYADSPDHVYHESSSPILYLDENPGGTTVHYRVFLKKGPDSGSGTYSVWMNPDSNRPSILMLEEIAG
tara:strand:- start:3595 stop:4158 length:564 start_codon:yes stop_codon:yes gene_type:complete